MKTYLNKKTLSVALITCLSIPFAAKAEKNKDDLVLPEIEFNLKIESADENLKLGNGVDIDRIRPNITDGYRLSESDIGKLIKSSTNPTTVKICENKNCVDVINPVEDSNSSYYTQTLDPADKEEDKYYVYISNRISHQPKSFNLKAALLRASKKGINLNNAKLVIIPVHGVIEKINNNYGKIKSYFSGDSHLSFSYKGNPKEVKFIPLSNLQINKNIKVTNAVSFRLQYVAAKETFKMFSPPVAAYQSRIMKALMPSSTGTLKDYLTMNVFYNLTRSDIGWKTLRQLAADEKNNGSINDYESNSEIKSLAQQPFLKAIESQSLKSLANQYMLQTAELKIQIAEYAEANSIEDASVIKVSTDDTANMSRVPSYTSCYRGGMSYQEKLAKYQYYSTMTDNTINGLAGMGSAATGIANLILR
jgi:hypothetical protein